MASTDPQLRRLARQLTGFDKRLHDLETVPQLAHSSIDDYGLPVYDADGNLVTKVGKQDDGTWGAPPLAGPTPPAPRGVTAIGGPGTLNLAWTGEFETEAAPLDFDALEVLVDGTLAGSIPNRDGGTVSIAAEQGTRYVSARIRTLVPRHSTTISPFSVEVGPPADQLFLDAREAIEAAEDQIQDAKDLVAQETLDREAALQQAAADLAELDGKLAGLPQSSDLAAIRTDLAAAQDAVTAAQADATAAKTAAATAAGAAATAQTTAEAAASSALAAAGIAADKGRIIYAPTEPTGDDRSSNNLWIDSDNGKVYVWTGVAWEESQSEDLRDAAQAAVAAQQAAEAADQKASDAAAAAATADAKASNAQTAAEGAQSVAEAAQTTANQATLDAGEAHNAAVTAQGAADDALAQYGPLDQRTTDAQAAADAAAQAAADAQAEAASKATPAEVTAAADAAESAAKAAAALDAKAKADQAKADALSGAAVTAQEKADAAKAQAVADASVDAKAKADQALSDALAALNTARGEISVEIATSVNGKNAITISTAAASSSTPGVVAGDTWWRVDDSGDIYAQWRWTGSSWSAVTIRSEVIANLDVHKLQVTGSAKMAEAVIEKLWVDGLAAKAITTTRLTVAPDNLVPNGGLDTALHWGGSGTSIVPITGVDGYATALTSSGGSSGPYTGPDFPVRAGEQYVFECWIRADKPGSNFYIELRDQNGDHLVSGGEIVSGGSGAFSSYLMSKYTVPTMWTRYRATFTARAGAQMAHFNTFYFNHSSGTERNAQVWVAGLSIRPRVGAVLIEDGSVGADKIIASEIAAEVSNLVTANVEKLVVTAGATIDEAVILKLAAEMITAGAIRTAETGQRVVIDATGIVMYGLDANDVEFELVRIGPSGENLITAGDTTISPSGVQAATGDFGELSVGGQDLSTIFDALPQGLIGNAYAGSASVWHGDGTEIRRLELDVTLRPGRRYRVTLDHNQVVKRTAGKMGLIRRLKHTHTGGYVTFAYARQTIDVSGPYEETLPALMGYISTVAYDADVDTTIGFTLQGTSGNDYRIYSDTANSTRLTVEDLGPEQANTGEDFMGEGTAVEGGNTTPPVEPPRTKRYTKTYTSTEAYTYNADGSFRSSSEVTQGLYGGGPSRFNRRGGWKFPSFTGDLSGSTVEKVEMYIYMNSSWSSAGATVNPATHNGNISNSLSSFTSISGWKRGTGKWITLPKSLYSGFKSGAYQGIGVVPTSTSTSQYAIFKASGAKIRITYTK